MSSNRCVSAVSPDIPTPRLLPTCVRTPCCWQLPQMLLLTLPVGALLTFCDPTGSGAAAIGIPGKTFFTLECFLLFPKSFDALLLLLALIRAC